MTVHPSTYRAACQGTTSIRPQDNLKKFREEITDPALKIEKQKQTQT